MSKPIIELPTENLIWFLQEFEAADESQLEDGGCEIYGEDEQGREGSCFITTQEICGKAAEAIKKLKQERDALAAHVENFNKICRSVHVPVEIWDIFRRSPQTSLAERDARVIKSFQSWALEFACSPDYQPLKRKMFHKLNGRPQGQQVMPHNDPEYCGLLALFERYTQRTKDGENV